MQLRDIIKEIFTEYDVDIKADTNNAVLYVCPFHSGRGVDHNAIIYTDTGYWYCLNESCGCNGNLVAFVSKMTDSSWKDSKVICKTKFGYNYDERVFLEEDFVPKQILVALLLSKNDRNASLCQTDIRPY